MTDYVEEEKPRLKDLNINLHSSAGSMGENEQWQQTTIPSPHTNCLKKCLWPFLGPRSDVEYAIRTDYTTHRPLCSQSLLIVAVLAMLALGIMGLLLFWNYQCIFVWHLCNEDAYLSSDSAFEDG